MASAGDVRRSKSCGRAPRKIVERILKRSVNALRIVRRQNSAAPVLQHRCRRPAIAGRDFERPAEMFARVAQADAQAIVTANLVIERADMGKLRHERWRGLCNTGLQAPADLTGQPRLALR